MTDLRRRMLEDMQLHGYAERTRKSYANAVGGLAGIYTSQIGWNWRYIVKLHFC